MFGILTYKYKKYLKHKFSYFKFSKSKSLIIEGNAIFCFHGFYNTNKGGTNSIYQTSRIELIDTINAINKRFIIVTLSELLDATYNRKKRLDKPLAAITIDDGFSSIMKVLDIFQNFSILPTIFICPDLIEKKTVPFPEIIRIALLLTNEKTIKLPDGKESKIITKFQNKMFLTNIWIEFFKTINHHNLENELNCFISEINVTNDQIKKHELYDSLLSWDEIKDLDKKNEIGSHTSNHYCLPLQSSEQAQEEIFNSKQIIEEKLLKNCSTFCFPFGDSSSYSNREINFVKQAGYKYAFSLESGYANPGTPNFCIPRYNGLNAFLKL